MRVRLASFRLIFLTFDSFSPPITLFYFFVSFSFSGFSRVGESLFPLPSVGISFSFLDEDNKASVGRSVGRSAGGRRQEAGGRASASEADSITSDVGIRGGEWLAYVFC